MWLRGFKFAGEFMAPIAMWRTWIRGIPCMTEFLLPAVAGRSCMAHGAKGRPLPEEEKSIQCVGSQGWCRCVLWSQGR